jgi:hypothetical protein
VTSDDAIAQRNFCVLIIHVEELDWIYLDHRGNRRARFRWGGNDVASPLPQSQWLQH